MKLGYHNLTSNIPQFGSLNIFYNAGSHVETPGYRGISHLVEHLLLYSAKEIYEELDSFGITHNASTSENSVCFYINGLNKHLKKFESRFLDLLNFIPSKEQFDHEKKVILAEYDMIFNQTNSIYYNICRKYYNNFGPIGYYKDIESITYEQYLEFQKTYFSNPTAIIRVGETEISDVYSSISYGEYTKKDYVYSDYDNEIEWKLKLDTAHIVNCFETSLNELDRDFISTYLSNGLASPLYQELREKYGLVYFVSSNDLFDNENSPFIISYQSSKTNYKKCQKLIKKLMKEIKPNEVRFEHVKSHIESKLEKIEILNFSNDYAQLFYFDNNHLEHCREMSYEKFCEKLNCLTEDFKKNSKEIIATKGLKL